MLILNYLKIIGDVLFLLGNWANLRNSSLQITTHIYIMKSFLTVQAGSDPIFPLE